MKSIGVRELRQQASKYLRLVQAGEVLELTDRGRPVALLVPIPSGGAIERLEREDRLSAEEGDLLDLGRPLPARRGAPLPSEALTRSRADER